MPWECQCGNPVELGKTLRTSWLLNVTKMVNNPTPRILVTGACVLRPTADGRRKIHNGPVYDLAVVQRMLPEHGLRVVNDTADKDMRIKFKPLLLDEELPPVILALRSELRVESERCRTSLGFEMDCDAYRIKWDRTRCREWEHANPIYIKFGFRDNNPRCLVASIHPSSW